jgi:hypothetical protein
MPNTNTNPTQKTDLERIRAAINFFRQFQTKSDSQIYRTAVLRFCDLVETEILLKDIQRELI